MASQYIATTIAGAEQLAHALAHLHDLPRKGTHMGGGRHVAMPDAYFPGRAHLGWSVRPYPNIRRLHPTLNQWGVLITDQTRALWDDPVIRAEKLSGAQIQSIGALLPAAQNLNATWNAATQQPDGYDMGGGAVYLADGTHGYIEGANATAAMISALTKAGVGGTVVLPPSTVIVDPDTLNTPLVGRRRIVGTYVGVDNVSTLVPSGPGDYILKSTDPVALENFFVSCTQQPLPAPGVVNKGIWLLDQAATRVVNVGVGRALEHGWLLERVQVSAFYLAAGNRCGQAGIKGIGCNSSAFYSPYTVLNGKTGLWFVGVHADPMTNAGYVRIFGGTSEVNTECQVLIDGLTSGVLCGMHTEGGEGIVLDHSTHNFSVRDVESTGGVGPQMAAIRIKAGCKMNRFSGVSSGSSQRPDTPGIDLTGLTLTFSAAAKTVSRQSGSWLTDLIRAGMPIFIGGTASNNLQGAVVTAVTDQALTLGGSPVVNEGPVSNATVSVQAGTPWDQCFDRIVIEDGQIRGNTFAGCYRNSDIQVWELRAFDAAGNLLVL